LIDDIFYTGRTTRAAMNELFDYGRPASITLAVLINRGGAQLPIAPQITGANVALQPHQAFQLSQDTSGKLHLSLESETPMQNNQLDQTDA
jgi:pyrimidine operon attenuation protein/uracil phosphoribosyltransferase